MEKEPQFENPLGTQPINRLIWKFAIPGIITQLVNALHNIVDQVFIGWGIGDFGVASTSILFPITSIITALSALIGLGAASRFSILLGKKQYQEASDIFGNAISLLLLFGSVLTIGTSVFLKPMLYLFGATERMMPYAQPYARIICIGILFGVFSTGMSYFIRADGNPNYSSFVLLAGAVFNMIFDPVFLFVFDMGIAGIALATVFGQLLSAALALFYLLKKLKSVRLSPGNLSLRLPLVRSIFSLGFAVFTTHILAALAQIIQMNALKRYGALSVYGSEAAIAAAGAVGKLSIVFLSSIIGISLGCQPIFGYNLGKKQYDRVKETYLTALRWGTIIAASAFLILQLFPGQILRIFSSDNPLFYEFAARYIHIYMAMLFLNAIQPITSTFCTAIGKAKLGFWMAVIRQGILLIPLLLFLPPRLGIDGVLFSGAISDGAAAIIVIFIARKELRQLTKLQKPDA
ncbi:MAG: MATE family efflux transporter [Lachnospiraceae bacterium]|nr:MATE family efflux transporter [Lachnospiraceae bacterium]